MDISWIKPRYEGRSLFIATWVLKQQETVSELKITMHPFKILPLWTKTQFKSFNPFLESCSVVFLRYTLKAMQHYCPNNLFWVISPALESFLPTSKQEKVIWGLIRWVRWVWKDCQAFLLQKCICFFWCVCWYVVMQEGNPLQTEPRASFVTYFSNFFITKC